MIDLAALSFVPQTGGQFFHQSIVLIGGLEQQRAAVGTALSLIKLGNYRLAKNSWEQQTLCCAIVRHEEASGVLSTAFRQPVCSTGGFSCLKNHELFRLGFSPHFSNEVNEKESSGKLG